MVQVDDSHFCNYPMYYILAFSRSSWNLKSRNDRHDWHTPAPMGPAQGAHGKSRPQISSQRKKDEIQHFSSWRKNAENAQNCGQIQFSARVSCDMTWCWKLASLRSKYAHICLKKSWFCKMVIFTTLKNHDFSNFQQWKLHHIWATFRRHHHSAA